MASPGFSCVNVAVYDKMLRHLEHVGPVCSEPESDIVYEYGDCKYMLQTSPPALPGQPSQLLLSFAFPELPEHFSAVILHSTAMEMIKCMYAGVAKIVSTVPGYQVTLDIDARFLTRLSKSDRESAVKNLASIRTAVIGAPLREHFMRLSRDEGEESPIERHWNRPGQVYYVKPEKGKVVVLFPFGFVSKLDAAIGTSFLKDFVEVRKQASLGLAPSCQYFPADKNMLPSELEGLSLESPSASAGEVCDGGIMSFTLLRRHVDGPQLEHVLWSLSSFYYSVSQHIKGAKAMIHCQMRSKISAMGKDFHGADKPCVCQSQA